MAHTNMVPRACHFTFTSRSPNSSWRRCGRFHSVAGTGRLPLHYFLADAEAIAAVRKSAWHTRCVSACMAVGLPPYTACILAAALPAQRSSRRQQHPSKSQQQRCLYTPHAILCLQPAAAWLGRVDSRGRTLGTLQPGSEASGRRTSCSGARRCRALCVFGRVIFVHQLDDRRPASGDTLVQDLQAAWSRRTRGQARVLWVPLTGCPACAVVLKWYFGYSGTHWYSRGTMGCPIYESSGRCSGDQAGPLVLWHWWGAEGVLKRGGY